jgi:dipeptidyl aminopeptidase/acylaminoacyl peptidase
MRRLIFLSVFLIACVLFAAGPNFPTPSNLKPEGLPPTRQEVFDGINRYSEFRTAALLDWSPSKREILIATRFGDVPQIHRVAMPGGTRQQLTFYPDRVTQALFNPANGDEMLFRKDEGGGEFYQLFLDDLRSGKITQLTKGGRTRNTGPIWSRDGKYIAYSSTARDGQNGDIWIEDPHNPASARILLETIEPGWEISDWSADGRQMLLALEHSAVVSEVYLLDVASGQKRKLGPDSPEAGWFNPKFAANGPGADGQAIYAISNDGGDTPQVVRIESGSGKATPLEPGSRWEVDDLAVSRDGRDVAFLTNEDGFGKLHVWDTALRSEAPLPPVPEGVIDGLRWRDTGHEIGFSVSSSHSPGDAYSVDLDAGRVTRWTYSETGGLNAGTFAPAQLIHWQSFDARTISGFLYTPPARFTGPRPVIVNIHGGPEGQSRPGYLGATNYYMSELGIAMIYPNVRGSTGYGKTYLNLDNGMKREDSVKDIGALLDWIKTQPNLDANRIMITGGSYGGYMTLAVMTHYSDRVRCAVEQVGISNFRTFLEHTEAYRRDLRRVEYGDERDPKMRDFFETISPLNNSAKITKPMFIVAGRNDPRVPWTEGQQMTEALRKNNVPVWWLVAEDEGHGFAKKKNRDYLAAATAEFVEQYLIGR